MKNYFILISIGVFILGSCKKPKTDKPYIPVIRCTNLSSNADSINLYIHGNWEWVEEYRITRNGTEYTTPDSPGENHISLKLSGDTARFYRNNYPDSIYRFKIQKLSDFTNYPDDSIPVIAYYSFYTGIRKSLVPIMICRNQLLMLYHYISSFAGEGLWVRKD